MRLDRVEISGYRSIKDRIEIHFDSKVTVILGANDHGKTNALQALTHLNDEKGFDRERDLNWDLQEKSDSLPHIRFSFTFDDSEKNTLKEQLSFSAQYRAVQGALSQKEKIVEQKKLVLAETRKKLDSANEEQISQLKDDYESAQIAENIAKRDFAVAVADFFRVLVSRKGTVSEESVAEFFDSVDKKKAELGSAHSKAKEAVAAARAQLDAANNSGDTNQISKAKQVLAGAEQKEKKAQAAANTQVRYSALAAIIREQVENFAPFVALRPATKNASVKIPDCIEFERKGIKGELIFVDSDHPENEAISTFAFANKPHVEIIHPVDKIPSTVNSDQIWDDEFLFMRGIFYYAGIAEDDWEGIFAQNDFTQRKLRDASAKLNETLRTSWSQGKELIFQLLHHSKLDQIELTIDDPAVKERDVRASHRSTGFTSFFALKTILHASRTEARASSYIWLFDEPGLYLHPLGQHDLIQVLETLAESNQIVYSTHSIFMINKNFPHRHRLVTKSESGTKIDGKPYVGRWKAAIDALGMSLPGTILFANHVVLVEGDSDPIYLNAILQKLIEIERITIDMNSLSFISTSQSKHADALIRILRECTPRPKIAAIFDGDEGGKDRAKKLKKLLEDVGAQTKFLSENTSIEDHIINVEQLFVIAVASYVSKLANIDSADALTKFQKDFADKFPNAQSDKIADVATWSREHGKTIGKLEDTPSPIGIAREYVLLLQESIKGEIKPGKGTKRAEEIAKWIADTLDLPTQTLRQGQIINQK